MIHKYIPRAKRKAHAYRMLSARQAKREREGVDADTLRWRQMHPLPPETIDNAQASQVSR